MVLVANGNPGAAPTRKRVACGSRPTWRRRFAARKVVLIAVSAAAPMAPADLSAVHAVARLVDERQWGKVVAARAPCPSARPDRIKAIISGLTKERISVASNPEFLKR